ncbi:hypothetical protein [Komagataeibacter xylinus]|uniref:hypothetical protein n=1 Tax=Komagataeibacter xylinus TaxID=28448 RepID=UPI00280C1226|nr:hypothetical protein [Komagataeibacter xylinus]
MTIHPPAQIDWLVAAIGEDAALQFIETAGGSRLSVPCKTAGSRLEQTFGPEVATALQEQHGGTYYDVPVCRHWRVRRYRQMGLSLDDSARRAGVSRRRVVQIMATHDDPAPQPRTRTRRNDPSQLSMF